MDVGTNKLQFVNKFEEQLHRRSLSTNC